MKYSEHFKDLDNELSQFYANFTFSMPSHAIIFFFNAYHNYIDLKHVYFQTGNFVVLGVRKLCDVLFEGV